MPGSWSLGRELCDLAALPHGRTTEALIELGLAPYGEGKPRLVQLGDWYRGGAETYILEFAVDGSTGRRRFLLKSCVALGDLSGTAGIVEEWMRRRQLLVSNGVRVSQVFGVHSSTLLEEWIPYELDDALQAGAGKPGRVHSILAQLGYLAGVLTREGFPAMSLHDLRSRGRDVVIVDVGEDLGPAGVAGREHTAILEQALALAEQSVSMGGAASSALLRGFDQGMVRPSASG